MKTPKDIAAAHTTSKLPLYEVCLKNYCPALYCGLMFSAYELPWTDSNKSYSPCEPGVLLLSECALF